MWRQEWGIWRSTNCYHVTASILSFQKVSTWISWTCRSRKLYLEDSSELLHAVTLHVWSRLPRNQGIRQEVCELHRLLAVFHPKSHSTVLGSDSNSGNRKDWMNPGQQFRHPRKDPALEAPALSEPLPQPSTHCFPYVHLWDCWGWLRRIRLLEKNRSFLSSDWILSWAIYKALGAYLWSGATNRLPATAVRAKRLTWRAPSTWRR